MKLGDFSLNLDILKFPLDKKGKLDLKRREILLLAEIHLEHFDKKYKIHSILCLSSKDAGCSLKLNGKGSHV